MHSHLLGQLADERRREASAAAQRGALAARLSQRGPAQSARQRAGWAMIEIGIRLANTSGGGHGMRPAPR